VPIWTVLKQKLSEINLERLNGWQRVIKRQKRVDWIELGRGCAALAVLLSHSPYVGVPSPFLPYSVPLGTWGVAFFFLLSGFIILYVHQDHIGNPKMGVNFVWRRFIRIFPTYWLVFLIYICLGVATSNPEYLISNDAGFLVHELLLLPGGKPFVYVAWTLRHELLFYGLFLILILNFRVGLILFVAWLALIIDGIISDGVKDDLARPPWDTMTSHLNLYFFFGMGIALASKRNATAISLAASSVLAVVILIAWAATRTTLSFAALQLFGCASVVCICVSLSRRGIEAPSLSLWLGAISYPLYLLHPVALFVAGGIWKRFAPSVEHEWLWKLFLATSIAVCSATLISRCFERPLFQLLRILRTSDAPSKNVTTEHRQTEFISPNGRADTRSSG
jgi:peptidoglycan/LPS O-acetylase OafA/YrhL